VWKIRFTPASRSVWTSSWGMMPPTLIVMSCRPTSAHSSIRRGTGRSIAGG